MFYALPDPDDQRAADEAMGRFISYLLGAGGIVTGFVLVLLNRHTEIVMVLQVSGALTLFSTIAMVRDKDSLGLLVAYSFGVLVELGCLCLLL